MFNLALCLADTNNVAEALDTCASISRGAGATSSTSDAEPFSAQPDVVLKCLQLQAGLLERSSRWDSAKGCLNAASTLAKQYRTDGMVAFVQQCTQHMLAITFRALSPTHRAVVERVAAAAAGAAPDRAVIQFVIQELFAADDVGEFVRMVVDAVARGSAGGFVSRVGGAQAPPPVAQLLALVTLSLAVTKTAA